MTQFKFQLDSLLKYRRYQRDLCRQALADILNRKENCQAGIRDTKIEREEVCEEIRVESEQGELNISQSSSRRFYLTQLDTNLMQYHLQLEKIEEQVDLCRKAVQQADVEVKALEQLRDHRLQQHNYTQEKRQEIEIQDTWSATQRISGHK